MEMKVTPEWLKEKTESDPMDACEAGARTLPPHLQPNAKHLVCDGCGRKSWGSNIGDSCDMPQPNLELCEGRFKRPK